MKDIYYDQAVTCVKDYVFPAQYELYKSCGGNLDKIYGEAMNGNGYFGKVIEPGHIYELGYEKCTCEKVLKGNISPIQSIAIVLGKVFYISSISWNRTPYSMWKYWKQFCGAQITADFGLQRICRKRKNETR